MFVDVLMRQLTDTLPRVGPRQESPAQPGRELDQIFGDLNHLTGGLLALRVRTRNAIIIAIPIDESADAHLERR